MSRDFHLPGRSAVYSVNGAAATSHPLASQAAIEILRSGGNAVDAAIAACAALGVIEPHMTGIGGDCFALVQMGGDGPVVGINGSGHAPAGLTVDLLREQGVDAIEPLSPHCVTVPGAIDAWSRLSEDYGVLGLDVCLQPAIRFAEEGFAVAPRVGADWAQLQEKLSHDANSRRVLLKDGCAPRVGERYAFPALADTLKTIAKKGRTGFYEGPVAEEMAAYLQSLGGAHTPDDFAAQRAEYVTPISTSYKGHDVLQIPPNGQGVTALLLLNILSGFDLSSLDPEGVERQHLEVEASRLAYAMRDRYIADPRVADVPVDRILSADYADALRAQIRKDRAMTDVAAGLDDGHRDTVYLCVVDRDLNSVSFINSLFHGFGSGLTTPTTGIVLQNRGCGFVLDPDHPNCVGPRKRPMHTIIPGMILNGGRCDTVYGVMGGQYQSSGHAHFVTNVLDLGMDVQAAIDAPRLFHNGVCVNAETGFAPSVLDGLRALGHEVVHVDSPWGGGQAIRIDRERGVLSAGSDPRKDGCALGY